MSDAAVPTIDLAIEADGWGNEEKLQALVSRVVAMTCGVARLDLVPNAELSVLLSDDARVRILNRAWRGKDTATNVLSFPGGDEDEPPFGPLLGDLALARETVAREADEMGIPFSDHLTHLVAHGFLHLFGYDHMDDREAEEMETLERQILAGLDIADPYGDALARPADMESETSR
ncbi:rRNA maturation RNase YbeY [Stappia sp. ES.058]|uniref:rRNA maturation RNase YbeY n=1 Tax=Stappia sp. ES.058 TaxID=1881061 RepID=UPI00087DB76E|nr:rRNA maturation RNase YbeY [Stappia sp. ES.058]SDU46482.1 probable rRNA maturation factor [Stappia sp. ES.058]